VAEPRAVHRRAANSAADERSGDCFRIARDRTSHARITALRWRNCADQNIVHASIVLGAGFE
jgi:hypothetical protein